MQSIAFAWRPEYDFSGWLVEFWTRETYDITRLNEVLELLNLLLQLSKTNLVILDDQVDLQLLDTETDGNKLRGTPHETVLIDTSDGTFQSLHVGLII